MTVTVFAILVFIFSIFAGLLGALTGLGGGVVIIPMLVLLFHINIHLAMGAALMSVIATSSGAAAAYLRKGYINLRIGMFLEVAAVIGALFGALTVAWVSTTAIAIIFSLVLFISAYLTIRRKEDKESYTTSHAWALKLKLNGDYPAQEEIKPYYVQHVPLAFSLLGFAGFLSGLLGIGSGTLKVLAMDQALRLPYKVSTTTSNFMIGITAAVSAGIYLTNSYINAVITFPVILGVIVGAYLGAKWLPRIHTRILRIVFSIVICLIAVQMLYQAITTGI